MQDRPRFDLRFAHHCSKAICPNFTKYSVAVNVVAVARSSSDGNIIRYLFRFLDYVRFSYNGANAAESNTTLCFGTDACDCLVYMCKSSRWPMCGSASVSALRSRRQRHPRRSDVQISPDSLSHTKSASKLLTLDVVMSTTNISDSDMAWQLQPPSVDCEPE